jgi:5-methylcytosine-specific restriction endonuclease McrA
MQTIVLNADYTYLNTVPGQRAVKLLMLQKAEALKETDRTISNCDKTCVLKIPLVLKLIQMVKTVYKTKVPYSRKNVFIRDEYTCQYCGTHDKLSVDHVVPSSRGGKTNFLNCVTSCVKCNVSKGDRTLSESQMRLHKIPHEPTIMEFLIHKMKHTGTYQFLKEIKVY